MQSYLQLLEYILDHGKKRTNRTKISTYGIFGYQMRFPLQKGFPLVTTKKIHIKSIVHELLWMLQGSTNIQYLQKHNVRIWNEWADENGELGPVYGHQWRSWSTSKKEPPVDQIQNVIQNIQHDPYSRRHIVTAWNPSQIEEMALPPCHTLFQFYVEENQLSCQLYQRSADVFLGIPFNIASYSLLTHMIAQVCGLEVGDFIHSLGDAHIYENHLDVVQEQLLRKPYPLPTLRLTPQQSIENYRYEHIHFENYQCHTTLKGVVAV